MKARRLPGVRCSTLNTECRSLLCLMIMPGRSWVAGIDIAGLHLLLSSWNSQRRDGSPTSAAYGINSLFYTGLARSANPAARVRVATRITRDRRDKTCPAAQRRDAIAGYGSAGKEEQNNASPA